MEVSEVGYPQSSSILIGLSLTPEASSYWGSPMTILGDLHKPLEHHGTSATCQSPGVSSPAFCENALAHANSKPSLGSCHMNIGPRKRELQASRGRSGLSWACECASNGMYMIWEYMGFRQSHMGVAQKRRTSISMHFLFHHET